MAFSIRLDVKGFDKRIKQLTEEIERHETAKSILAQSIAELETIENKGLYPLFLKGVTMWNMRVFWGKVFAANIPPL
ncbi:MAG: hypothetical protein APF77_18365 [Clostridia bacterium BRH_c25]|nr:MAG: hypothetical protein APF77_18365 [Clostridia bacterium BRH_c25]